MAEKRMAMRDFLEHEANPVMADFLELDKGQSAESELAAKCDEVADMLNMHADEIAEDLPELDDVTKALERLKARLCALP